MDQCASNLTSASKLSSPYMFYCIIVIIVTTTTVKNVNLTNITSYSQTIDLLNHFNLEVNLNFKFVTTKRLLTYGNVNSDIVEN